MIGMGEAATAAAFLAVYRYSSSGPEQMMAGTNHIWRAQVAWAFDAVCDSVTNTCSSSDYTPTSADGFVPDPDQTMPGGVQNTVYELSRPIYKATNIGTNGNAANHWNLFQNRNAGPAPVQVTLTSSATIRFYLTWGYQAYPYLRRTVG